MEEDCRAKPQIIIVGATRTGAVSAFLRRHLNQTEAGGGGLKSLMMGVMMGFRCFFVLLDDFWVLFALLKGVLMTFYFLRHLKADHGTLR